MRHASADPIPAAAGIGLRFQHHNTVLADRPRVAWLEVHAENYFGGGRAVACLDRIRRDYPLSLHGVGLSLGSADRIDPGHLDRLWLLVERVAPGLVSEHLSWSAVAGVHFAELLPLPLTEEALTVVCRNVEAVQDRLGRQILVENPSTYLCFRHSTMPEWEFITVVAERTGCGILCDVNNVFVSACNHGFDPWIYLEALPADHVSEIHLAGHSLREFGDGRSIRIDDHGSPVCPAVWELYRHALRLFGPVPTLIEWDRNIPPLQVLLDEAATAGTVMEAEAADAATA